MILADTSIWINHLNKTNAVMSRLLRDNKIVLHPFVIGEIALGNLRNRQSILTNLLKFRTLAVAGEQDVLGLIEINGLFGMGIGYVDCHLLASAALANSRLWTTDKRLAAAAQKLNLSV
jgi:predicted nucleic acid-binding protein